jgi:uncharacterized membrane protein YdjX (TVP38/TMEM64 family)
MSLDNLKSNLNNIIHFRTTHPFAVGLLYFFLYVIVAALAVPGATVLTLAGGALFGLIYGTLIVSAASTIGSTLAFLVARHLMRDSLQKKYAERTKKIDKLIKSNGSYFLFFLRLNPVIPFFLLNSLMGLTAISLPAFFYVSLVGMFPGTILYVNAGTQLSELESLSDLLSWNILSAFFALGLFPLAVKLITKKLFKSASILETKN